MGIEPTLSAWEAEVLPLNYTRSVPGGKTHSPRAGIVHHPRRMRFTDLSCDRSPDGSLHAFASGNFSPIPSITERHSLFPPSSTHYGIR